MNRKRIIITVEEAPRLHFALNLMIPDAPNDSPPDCIVQDCDLILVKVAQYADGKSNHYRYRRASVELFDWFDDVEMELPENSPLDAPEDTPSLDTSFHDNEMDVD